MPNATTTILIVDDDPRICRLVARYLSREGYATETASNGAELRQRLDDGRPDLVILDLMLPGEDGLSLVRTIRELSDIPIIMLTGKAETVDKVVGLEMGADDYMTKPFEERELLARVRTVLRRTSSGGSDTTRRSGVSDILRFASWTFDAQAAELYAEDGERVHLTSSEFRVLGAMLNRPNRVFTRDELLDLVTERNWTPYDRSVDVLIGKLRRKIETDPKRPSLIKSIRGLGYKFAARVDRGQKRN